MKMPTVTPEQFYDFMQKCYEMAKEGIPGTKSCSELAEGYLQKYSPIEAAAHKFVNVQVAKCTTSGFLTGIGGLITLPVAIPANLSSVLYVQMRMIMAIAYMAGYNLNDDEVQTLVYICLANLGVSNVLKQFGIKFGQKAAIAAIKKIPGKALIAINKRVAFRLFTKFGEQGLINLGKTVPVVGGFVGGGFDYVDTRLIGKRAIRVFIENDYS